MSIAADAALPGAARIGPNAVLQTLRAVGELEAPAVAWQLRARADLPVELPGGMIPEAWFVHLVAALRDTLPPAHAELALRRAGAFTADYVMHNRIPLAVRTLLRVLPSRIAVPMLLAAFRRNAWTFAGAGRFRVEGSFPGTLILEGAPTARPEAHAAVDAATGRPLACSYYEAAFEGLLRLASPRVRVREVSCQARRDPACRFQISLTPSTVGEVP